jgi:hypothetical protein
MKRRSGLKMGLTYLTARFIEFLTALFWIYPRLIWILYEIYIAIYTGFILVLYGDYVGIL